MICPQCGHENPEVHRYCGMCGSTLNRRSAPATELQPEDAENLGHPDAGKRDSAAPEAADTGADLRARVRAGFERGAERKPVAADRPKPDLEELAQQAARPQEPLPVAPVERASFGDSTSMFHLNDVPPVPIRSEAPAGVTGPSFLGLGAESSSSDYLLEDEHRGGAKKWVLLFLVLAVGGLVYAQYRANQRGTTLFAGLPAITAPKPAKPAPPLPTGTQQNSGQPELTASAPNEKLKQEQQATKPPDGNQPADNAAKPASDQPDQKTATTASTPAPQENKPATAAENKPAPSKSAEEQKPDSDDSEEAAPAPAKRASAKPTKPAAAEKPAGSDLLEQGQRYLYGQGVRKSCDQALSLIHQAANQGNARARAQLGGLYATGNCVQFDRATAYRWFTLALQSEPGNRLIDRNRRMLWDEMTSAERSRVQAGLE